MQNNKVKQKKWYERLVSEESDVALVRVFECFLEAAPQKILQISIILSGEESITSEFQIEQILKQCHTWSKNELNSDFSSTVVKFMQLHVQYGLVHRLLSSLHSFISNW